MALCLQYRISSPASLAWSIESAVRSILCSPQYNARTGRTESTQCYVHQSAVNCRSAIHVFVHTQQYQEHHNNAYSLEIDRKQSPLLSQLSIFFDALLRFFIPKTNHTYLPSSTLFNPANTNRVHLIKDTHLHCATLLYNPPTHPPFVSPLHQVQTNLHTLISKPPQPPSTLALHTYQSPQLSK
jgi:hypothetical protein